MQLSVTQTITSTEDNYKANVNFTGDYSCHNSASEPKISNVMAENGKYKHESQFIEIKENRNKLHISTAYKDNEKYTVYEVKTLT